jgi:hypothetical protein
MDTGEVSGVTGLLQYKYNLVKIHGLYPGSFERQHYLPFCTLSKRPILGAATTTAATKPL